MRLFSLIALITTSLYAAPIDGSTVYPDDYKFIVNLPYSIERYEAPAPVAPVLQIESHWHPGDDHGHHGQVPEPGTWAMIGGGLMVVAIKGRTSCNK